MNKIEIIAILEELKKSVEEYTPIMYESTSESKELHVKISELYGKIQDYYLRATGNLNIEVPIGGGSQLKSKHNNYFEAGYLSGRSFHTHQGYTELNKVLGIMKSKDFNIGEQIMKTDKHYSLSEIIGIASIIGVLLGGAFTFGKYYGETKYDLKKIELTKENDRLENENSKLISQLKYSRDSLSNILPLIKDFNLKRSSISDLLSLTISYIEPTSIFEGQILISAEDSYKKKLKFIGISGLDKDIKGEFKEKSIEINKGDRFYIKLENQVIWIANVISISTGIEIELCKKI
ncbi:MAG: LapA family protein [Tenuifilaceae bacterium]